MMRVTDSVEEALEVNRELGGTREVHLRELGFLVPVRSVERAMEWLRETEANMPAVMHATSGYLDTHYQAMFDKTASDAVMKEYCANIAILLACAIIEGRAPPNASLH